METVKSAQDIMELLRRAGGTAKDTASGAGSALAGWYGGLDPELKKTVLRGAAGAGAGALLTGGIAAATPRDRDRKGGIVTPALTGALMGGIGAAGLPVGLKMMTGRLKFPQEKKKPMVDRMSDGAMAPFLRNPGASLGGLFGAAKFGPGALDAYKAVSNSSTFKSVNPTHIAKIKALAKATPWGARLGIPAAVLAGMLVDRKLKGRG